MNRKQKAIVTAIFAFMLGVICVLGYKLYEARKWSDIYFRHMMQTQDELEKYRAEQSAKSSGVTIPNPLYRQQEDNK